MMCVGVCVVHACMRKRALMIEIGLENRDV